MKNLGQHGFTLVEVLAGAAILGLISAGLGTAVYQTLNVNAMANSHNLTLRQVETAAFWLGRDVQMAQTVEPTGAFGFPLHLSWVEWGGSTHEVTYSLANESFIREHSLDGAAPEAMVVANFIDTDPGATNCGYVDGSLSFKVTAEMGGFRPATKARAGQVIPRSAP